MYNIYGVSCLAAPGIKARMRVSTKSQKVAHAMLVRQRQVAKADGQELHWMADEVRAWQTHVRYIRIGKCTRAGSR